MRVEITEMDHKGNGMVRIDNKIVFIPKCIPGDLVDIEIVKSHKKYDEGRIVNIINSSSDRIDAICPYYDVCGGCNISNLNYSKQLEYKRDKVRNIFKKYLKIKINPEIIGSDNRYEYRNKITFHCVDGVIGLFDINNKLIEISECLLVSDRVNKLYKKISLLDLSKVKKVTIKECDNGLILSIDGNMIVDNLEEDCISIYINNKCVYKKEDGYIFIGDIKYRVDEKSFFQVNTTNISKLYNVVLKYGNFKDTDMVVDLYCGVGSISLYVAKYVKNVLGIEIIDKAIDDARENAKLNNINNVEFICGDVSKLVDDNIFCDTLIVDPPRVGLDKHTNEVINNSGIDRVIYVSCDPMTLVRDLLMLDNYKVEDITLVDMFSNTHHIECVILLQRKD
ncbi:MAG: class I SAM-dependent RNA methyltransferase [Bacilli bacterium]|nr:class I SAM-dependent RNA methyltransferase [Bacilli bacterium]